MQRREMTVLGTVLCLGLLVSCEETSGTNSYQGSFSPTTSATIKLFEHDIGRRDSFYLRASDQFGDGTSVLIEEVVLTGTSGWIAIHSNGHGGPGEIIGVSDLLPPGTTGRVRITLNKVLESSDAVFPMLHMETNNNSTYDFPRADGPARINGELVMLLMQLYVRPSS